MSEHLDELKAAGIRQSVPREGINFRTTILRFGIAVTAIKPVDWPCGSITDEQLITWGQFENANFDIIKSIEDQIIARINQVIHELEGLPNAS